MNRQHVMDKYNVMLVAANKKTCRCCRETFYGRADAAYCSRACQQKAYRERVNKRHVIDNSHVTDNNSHVMPSSHVMGPVPVGDDWMVDRFATEESNWDGYKSPTPPMSLAEAEALPVDGEGWSATKKKKAERERVNAIDEASHALKWTHYRVADYVARLTSLRRSEWNEKVWDLEYRDAPLGDALPATIDPKLAAKLADQLAATMPRITELLALLRRRAGEDQDSEQWVQVPI